MTQTDAHVDPVRPDFHDIADQIVGRLMDEGLIEALEYKTLPAMRLIERTLVARLGPATLETQEGAETNVIFDGYDVRPAWPGEVQPTLALGQASKATADVLAARRRQVEVEGWTHEHDDQHKAGEIAAAAACYALHDVQGGYFGRWLWTMWPWHRDWWKPKDRRRDLVRAGALIIAEIERIDRAAEREANHA